MALESEDPPVDLNRRGTWEVDEIHMLLQRVRAGTLSPFSVIAVMTCVTQRHSEMSKKKKLEAWFVCLEGCLDVVDGLIGKWDAYKDQKQKEREALAKKYFGGMRTRDPGELGNFFWELWVTAFCFPHYCTSRTLRLLTEGARACNEHLCMALFAAQRGDCRTVTEVYGRLFGDVLQRKNRSSVARLIYAAALGGDIETFKFVVEKSFAFNVCGDSLFDEIHPISPPIRYAIQTNQIELVQYLLSESGFSSGELMQGDSCLAVACRSGHLEMIEVFLPLEDAKEVRALEEAAEGGHVDAVQFLLEGEHSSIAEEGWDALAAAVRGGKDADRDPGTHAEVIAVLAGMEGIISGSKALLSTAASYGNEHVVQALLDARDALGLDLNGGRGLKPPILAAVEENHVAVVEIFMNTPGLVASKKSHIKDKEGWTPLHFAAHAGFAEVCALLLRGSDVNAGVNPNVTDRKGMTPLHLAAERLHLETVKVLAGAEGIDINRTVHIAKIRGGSHVKDFTPLQLALTRAASVRVLVVDFLRSVGGRAVSPPPARRSTRRRQHKQQ